MCFHDETLVCMHVFGAEYGQTRGAARKLLVDSGDRPYLLLKNALGAATADRLFSGNRVGIPTMQAARHISGEASRAGRLDDDLAISLLKLSAHYEEEDRKRPSDQLLSLRQKRIVWGLVFSVVARPVNVIITTEGTCRIYAKMLDTEPGFWGDYTGGLTKKVCCVPVVCVGDVDQPSCSIRSNWVARWSSFCISCWSWRAKATR